MKKKSSLRSITNDYLTHSKQQNGITLISLVITVIILLILAGVAISMALNEGNLFDKANEAKTSWNMAVTEEESKIKNYTEYMDYYGEVLIEQAVGTGNLSEGDGSEENPYKIQSIEDLVSLSNFTKNRQLFFEKYYNKVFILERNLDFKNEKSYIAPNGTSFGDINKNGIVEGLMIELTTGEGFQPIGVNDDADYFFLGKINGNNKTIVNLYENTTSKYSGLFGKVTNCQIQNLTLKDVNLTGKHVGGLIGAFAGKNTISNIRVSGSITGSDATSGIAAYSYWVATGSRRAGGNKMC